jgi:hypothetical protein
MRNDVIPLNLKKMSLRCTTSYEIKWLSSITTWMPTLLFYSYKYLSFRPYIQQSGLVGTCPCLQNPVPTSGCLALPIFYVRCLVIQIRFRLRCYVKPLGLFFSSRACSLFAVHDHACIIRPQGSDHYYTWAIAAVSSFVSIRASMCPSNRMTNKQSASLHTNKESYFNLHVEYHVPAVQILSLILLYWFVVCRYIDTYCRNKSFSQLAC